MNLLKFELSLESLVSETLHQIGLLIPAVEIINVPARDCGSNL